MSVSSTNSSLFTLSGHAAPVTAVCFVASGGLSDSDCVLVSGAADGSLAFWDLTTRTRLGHVAKAHSRTVSGVAANRSGMLVVSVGWDAKIKVSGWW